METRRLRTIQQPSHIERLLEALVSRANLLPKDSYQIRDPDALPPPLAVGMTLPLNQGPRVSSHDRSDSSGQSRADRFRMRRTTARSQLNVPGLIPAPAERAGRAAPCRDVRGAMTALHALRKSRVALADSGWRLFRH